MRNKQHSPGTGDMGQAMRVEREKALPLFCGILKDFLWFVGGFLVDSLWISCGLLVDVCWMFGGFLVDFWWISEGFFVDVGGVLVDVWWNRRCVLERVARPLIALPLFVDF